MTRRTRRPCGKRWLLVWDRRPDPTVRHSGVRTTPRRRRVRGPGRRPPHRADRWPRPGLPPTTAPPPAAAAPTRAPLRSSSPPRARLHVAGKRWCCPPGGRSVAFVGGEDRGHRGHALTLVEVHHPDPGGVAARRRDLAHRHPDRGAAV